MEEVLRYSLPVLHPVFVHFPVAFSGLATLVVLIWLIRDRPVWLSAALCVQTLAFVGALIAFLSGEKMEEQSEGVPIVDQFVHVHEDAAIAATWILGITLAAILSAYVYSRYDTQRAGTPVWMRMLVFLFSFAGATAIVWTAHIGGIMVWGTL